MVGNQYIRDYEVSIWTLQDSFITVLKQSKLENREKIQDPKMILKDDGENTLSFKIPMYLAEDSDLQEKPYFKKASVWKENPIWYTTRNGNIIANMRKIKVIFNKRTDKEEVFEFIINKVTEEHDGYSKYCKVECSGLAFHELGKQGYEITLSADNFFAEYGDWLNSDRSQDAPKNNINYWADQILANSPWNYLVYMDWAAYDGIIDNGVIQDGNDEIPYLKATQAQRDTYNAARESAGLRRRDVIYRDPYVSSWALNGQGVLTAETSVTDLDQLEKLENVESSKSNRYNLLQAVAEAFGVFCKFQYLYDDNYHIIDRQVIFYNNFLSESSGFVDFTYGYNTNQLTREMDSTDLVSKMFVSSLKDTGTLNGEVSIADSLANPSLENYLLNFDYLYQIETISKEQYDEVKFYQASLRTINQNLINLYGNLNAVEQQIPEEEANRDAAAALAAEAANTAASARARTAAIGNGSTPEFTTTNPHGLTIIHTSSGNYYANIYDAFSGLLVNTFRLYANKACTSAINNLRFERDSNNLITKVYFPSTGLSNNTQVFATFKYDPNTPSKIVEKMWGTKENQARQDKAEAEQTLTRLNNLKSSYESQIADLLAQKQQIKNDFEKLMGPALREGTWQPEDKYSNYQMNGSYSLDYAQLLNNRDVQEDSIVSFNWIAKVDREEEQLTYHYDINDNRYYPCIDLRNVNLANLNVENLNLVYRDIYLDEYDSNYPETDPRVNHYLQVGAENGCQFAFLRQKNNSLAEIIPVLIVKGVESLLDTEKSYDDNGTTITTPYSVETQLKQDARLSQITYTNGNLVETPVITKNNLTWISGIDFSTYELVYPRFRITSLNFLTTTPESMIYRGTTPLLANIDYYLLYKEYNAKFGYFITLKPEAVIFHLNEQYSFHYVLSTTSDAVYLDAIEILKENSMPKVSYSIKPLAVDTSFISIAYSQLGQLIHINDYELKFENVQGYISEVELDLDRPQEDTYTIKNYKTKFEDIFSTIVAQTASMQKNSQLISMTANLIDANGSINPELLTTSLLHANIEKIIGEYTPSALQLVTAQNTANLAASTAYKIINGEVGLSFPATNMINSVQLNTNVGLLIEGKVNETTFTSFRATNNEMGFYKRTTNPVSEEALLSFTNGDLAIKGTVYAETGWFGGDEGWIISSGSATVNSQTYPGGLFYSANEQAIFYAGNSAASEVINKTPIIKLYKKENNDSMTEIFSFANGDLNITGTIYATAGKIGADSNNNGGWVINNGYIGSNNGPNSLTSTTAGLYLGPDGIRGNKSGDTSTYFKLTDGTLTAVNADLSGKITAKEGFIGGLTIKDGYLTTNTSRTSYNAAVSGMTIDGNGIGGWNSSTQYFTLTKTGLLTAAGATISGALTATSLSTGGRTSATAANGTFIDSNGAIYGGQNKFTVTSAGKLTATEASISGAITATSGTIGGCTIDTNGNLKVPSANITGTITANAVAANVSISAPTITGGSLNIGNGVFEVDSSGNLTATSATIGGEITARKLTISQTAFQWVSLSPYTGENMIDQSDSFEVRYGALGDLVFVQGYCTALKGILTDNLLTDTGGPSNLPGLPMPSNWHLAPTFIGTFIGENQNAYGFFYGEISGNLNGKGSIFIDKATTISGSLSRETKVALYFNFTYLLS